MELVVKMPFENFRAGEVITEPGEVARLMHSPFVTRRMAAAKPIPQRVFAPVAPIAPIAPAPVPVSE